MVDNYLELLVKNIKKLMNGRKNLWLAQASGLTESNISRTLSGKTEPMFVAVCKIADALGCSIDDLIGKSVPKNDMISKIGELTMELERIKNHPVLVSYEKAEPDSQYVVRLQLGLEENEANDIIEDISRRDSKAKKSKR